MESNTSIIPYLFLATFVVALLWAAVQYRKVSKARREHHRSAAAEAHHEPVQGATQPRPRE